MNRTEQNRTFYHLLVGMIVSAGVMFFPALADAFPEEPICDQMEQVCLEEDFSAYTIASYINVGNPYTSPNGFYFEHLFGPTSQFQIHNLANIGNAIYSPGQVAVMELPQPMTDVRFVVTGGGMFNFSAYDVNGGFLFSETVEVYGTAKSVHLYGVDLYHVLISHVVDSETCALDFGEPMITSIRACESNFEQFCG